MFVSFLVGKVHTLYDIETQIPAFFHITEASVNDVKAMDKIPYEPSFYYVFDHGYNDFKRLYKIHLIGARYVVRAKTNLKYRCVKWRRRLQKNILSDARIRLTGFYSEQHYPEDIRHVRYWDEDQKREFTFLTNAMDLTAQQIADLYKNRWHVELFSNGSSNISKSRSSGAQLKMQSESKYTQRSQFIAL